MQQSRFHELGIGAGDVELPRPFEVNAAGRRPSQGAMPEVGEIAAALVALGGLLEYLFRLHVHEAQAHRTMPQNALQMAQPAASAEALFAVQRDHAMGCFPYPFGPWIAA